MIYMFLADGFEEIEAIATLDVLRRANISVETVSIDKKEVKGAHNIKIITDKDINEISKQDIDGIILPGGMPGTLNLENSAKVQELITYAYKNGKLIGAICAAPSILGHMGLLQDKKATCFPGFEKDLFGAEVTSESVVREENIITAKGAGVAIDFGAEIVSYIKDSITADNLKEAMQCRK